MDREDQDKLERLVNECVKGNRQAQKELYKMYYGKMMSVCYRYANNTEEAKDVLQDGFVKVFQHLKSYNFKGSLEGWVRRIIVNTAIDCYRKNKGVYFVEDEDNYILDANYSESAESIYSNFGVEVIMEAIQELTPVYRTVFNLYVLEGYSHKEIADELEINEGTSKSNLAKAKRNLRQLLEKRMPKNMDKFEKLIKDKLEQHEVPFNEAHWNEMDAKLNSLKNVQYLKNIAIAASVVAVVAVSAYFISNNNMDDKNNIENYSTEVNTNEQTPLTKEETSNTNNTIGNTINNENNIQENHSNQNQAIEESKTEQLAEETSPFLVEDIKQKEIVENNKPENTNTTVADLNVQAEVLSSTVCLGQQVVFKSKVNAYNPSYLWDFGDGTTSNNAQPHHVYDKAGNYEVTLTVVNNETKQKTVEDVGSVTILPTPTKEFTYTEEALAHDKNKFSYPATTLKTENQNITAYLWKTNDGRTSTEATPSFVFEDKGTYDVKLMLTHQSGCYVEFTKSVEITLDMDLLAPSGFIPNSSIEENQTFIPKALLGWDVNFKMIITDKSGKLIYETTDKFKPWNGKLNNSGEQLPNDIYLWKVVTYDANGKAYHHNGTIRLMNK